MKIHVGAGLAVAALPFWLAVAAHSQGPQEQQVDQNINRPALAFRQYLVNLGEVPPGPYAWARFVFTNTSDRTIVIDELRPSCGCLNPQLKKKEFEPGEAGEFLLRVQSANEEPGPKEYYCDVIYNDPKPRETRVTFKVVLPKNQVHVRPKSLVFYQFSDQPTIREIDVTDYRKKSLRVVDVACSSEFAAVELGERGYDEDGGLRSKVIVKVQGNMPAGEHRALVSILTNDPDFPELKVPMLIYGPKYDTPPTSVQKPAETQQH